MQFSTSLRDRNILITGADGAIGTLLTKELSAIGATVYVACRSLEKARRLIEKIKSENLTAVLIPLELSLDSLQSVRDVVARLEKEESRINVLINNAGIHIYKRDKRVKEGREALITQDGFEITFQVNYLGHFLLTYLLLPTLTANAPSRIINVTSTDYSAYRTLGWGAFTEPTKTFNGHREYVMSKLALTLFNQELARRLDKTLITANLVSPGATNTKLWNTVPAIIRFFLKLSTHSIEEGVKPIIHCATAEELTQQSGLLFDYDKDIGYKRLPLNDVATDAFLAAELWEKSLHFAKIKCPPGGPV